MSLIGQALGKRRRPAPPSPRQRGDPPAPATSVQAPPGSQARSEMRRRRDALAEEVAELHWDLGGLAYEMAVRDHFRLDVLVRRAAVLQERDAELAELERLLAMEESATAGNCPGCGAPHSRGAVFCWQCGRSLLERTASSHASVDRPLAEQAPTAVMDALLAPWPGEGSGPPRQGPASSG
jgi:hypothetical protein